MHPTAYHFWGPRKDYVFEASSPLLRATESSLLYVRANEEGTPLPCREHEALARTGGNLQMPKGGIICKRSSPVDLLNTSLSRFASVWHGY